MELTQRLEFTQESNFHQLEKSCPEQIGFLGICGNKYPVKKGPNKIGRDPLTCNIVLNLSSVSRQHAVLNILNNKDFMLMDLDSANKTKLIDKTLQPYIPHPIKNGDTVQFGDIFGIFRLLEEDTDLPMTQAIDVPDTPVFSRNLSKQNQVPITMIPESPDLSDKDDSFICPSQPQKNHHFKSPNNRYIKTSGKTIAIQPVGSNKIDNVYWNSSKKSRSLNLSLNDSGTNLDNSLVSKKSANNDSNKISEPDIHEMETQVPYPSEVRHSNDSIYTAETQVPTHLPSIHTLETQVPDLSTENLPTVCKISDQLEMQCDFYTSNKENDISIYNAETQVFPINKEQKSLSHSISDVSIKKESDEIQQEPNEGSKSKMDESDDLILFDEIDNNMFEDDFDSQPLLPLNTLVLEGNENVSVSIDDQKKENLKAYDSLSVVSDTKNDCEAINMMATQKITKECLDDEDLTDCEEDITENNNEGAPKKEKRSDLKHKNKNINLLPTQKITEKIDIEDELTDCEDDLMQPNKIVKEDNVIRNKITPTQMIKEKVLVRHGMSNVELDKDVNVEFEDMPTQILENNKKELCFEEMPTQIIDANNTCNISDLAEVESPFKIPLQSPIRIKRKDVSKLALSKTLELTTPDSNKDNNLDGDDKYYAATQEIINDLCTQKLPFHEDVCDKNVDVLSADNEIVPSSVENYKLGERFPHITNEMSPKKNLVSDKSSKSNGSKQKVNQYESNISTKEIKEVIDNDNYVKPLRKMPSDPSDVEDTPKKVRSIRLMETELPDSQEIKTSVTLVSKNLVTESSSESEPENNSEECTPILFKNKKKSKPKIKAVKIDLTKRFDTEMLPTRIITRVRKPTAKVQNSEEARNFLKPKLLREQDDVDNEIITENISRLKSKAEKFNVNKDSKKDDLKVIEQNVSKQKIRELKSNLKTKVQSSKDNKQDSHKKSNKEPNKDEKEVREKSAEAKSIRNKSLPKTDDEKLPNTEHKSTETIGKTNENLKIVRSSRSKSKQDTESTMVEKHAKEKPPRKNKEKQTSKKKCKKSDFLEKNTNSTEIKNETKEITLKDSSPEVQIRRSRRQRTTKDKADNNSQNLDNKPALKRSKKINEDQSTIYSLSSESGVDSPKNLKRSGTFNENEPISKRSRSVIGSNNTSLRSTPARVMRAPLVLFTAFTETVVREVTVKLEKLGAVVVTDVAACSVLVTQQIKRTFKLLCAVGLGRPIVGPSWVQACHDTNIIVDPWLYLIKDEAAEKRFHFSLEKTLTSKRNFLKGYNLSSTPNVVPKGSEMKLIVECSGGTWKEGGQNWICISTVTDKHLWAGLKRRGATVVTAEFILGGVLRQQIDVKGNLLG